MTDNEIIKALECCYTYFDCDGCPFEEPCSGLNVLTENTLDLINRQKAEIERLQKSNEEMFCTISKQDAEITQLQKRIVFWREDMNYQPEKERAEAIKEFEKLVTRRLNCNTSRGAYLLNIMNEVKKEMTEQ